MKTRYSTIDLRVAINEINSKLLGMRVANCYDIDHKTYLIKLAKPDMKAMILIESANKIHITGYEWPKNVSPSGFSMKLRKHLRTRRLEKIEQLGIDRIIDLQFGSGEAAYHLIVELYDKGNLVLTDFEYNILNILRVRSDESQDVRFAVREKYPLDAARQPVPLLSQDRMLEILTAAKDGDMLKKVLNPQFEYGPAVIDHCLLQAGLPENAKIGKGFSISEDMPKLMSALEMAEKILEDTQAEKPVGKGGYIIQKRETKAASAGTDSSELLTYHEFHPFKYKHHENLPFLEFDSFNQAVDEFFSQIGSQKLDMKVIQQERTALKKLENVKKDHEKRLGVLQKEQELDKTKAQLIEMNLDMVDRAIKIVCSALANQIDWSEIWDLVKEAQAGGDPVASAIKGLKLDSNHITMLLGSPYSYLDDSDDDEDSIKPCKIDIDLGLSGYANARRYYDMKRTASKKEQKTVESSTKALKSAERKTKQTLKDVQVSASINKARKVYWFEKFLWFVSSENYLVIGGRDQQQNEIIYKKYLKPGDLYVHADLHGASSVVIKNHSHGNPIPPKTLNEAGVMAVCNSAAWDAKVVTSAWFVYHDQVSKTAPTGEYLSTGSFMIRGKKNYLPPCYLQYGFGFLFKLDEDSIFRHKGERRVRSAEEDASSTIADSESVQESLDQDDDDDDDNDDSDSSSDDGDDEEAKEERMESIDEVVEEEKQQGGEADVKEERADDKEDIKVASKSSEKEQTGAKCDTKEEKPVKDDDASLFPDTNIALQHVGGTQYQLQREISTEPTDDDYKFYLGDDNPLTLGAKVNKAGAKVSAKQRREMKKKKAKQFDEETMEDEEAKSSVVVESLKEADDDVVEKDNSKGNKKKQQRPQSGQQKQEESNQQAPPPKRGQKAKLKKMKEKYKDQDDEDKMFAMEFLGSAGVKKESTKKKKGKKGPVPQQGKGQPPSAKKPPPKAKPILSDKDQDVTIIEATDPNTHAQQQKSKPEQPQDDGDISDEEKQALLEEENLQAAEDVNTLDTLTGIPSPEDTLLFAIPVCAPYNAMTNFKYKVKLTPGNTRRGKAAKTALNMYMHDRTATSREKDLLRTVKDNDTSRNIPGKVKVSAPNLHKNKKK